MKRRLDQRRIDTHPVDAVTISKTYLKRRSAEVMGLSGLEECRASHGGQPRAAVPTFLLLTFYELCEHFLGVDGDEDTAAAGQTFQLLRNIGLFDSLSAGGNIPLSRHSLIYAENGREKTTLAAIMRSLATGDPLPISERRRLAAQHPLRCFVMRWRAIACNVSKWFLESHAGKSCNI